MKFQAILPEMDKALLSAFICQAGIAPVSAMLGWVSLNRNGRPSVISGWVHSMRNRGLVRENSPLAAVVLRALFQITEAKTCL